jgi:hypothetical protein
MSGDISKEAGFFQAELMYSLLLTFSIDHFMKRFISLCTSFCFIVTRLS